MIRHLVALRFPETVDAAAKADLVTKLDGLRGHLEGVVDFQSRANTSPETPLVRGFLDVFWFDFETAAARDAYLVDAEHQKVGGEIVALTEGGLDGVFVIDFEV